MGKAVREVSNLAGDITGSNRAAKAAEKAAGAQAGAAASTRAEIMNEARRLEREAMGLAEASPQELAALNRSYASAEQGLAREERLLASIDPALMEASQQALKLLRGESADINKPMMDLRNSQRQNLLNSLRSQYGPGAESSSIGQRTLQSFDMETNAMMSQQQQSALGQAFGIATSDLGARQQRGIMGLSQIGQGFGALQERKLGARTGVGQSTLAALSGTSQQMIQAAGAPYVGEAVRAQGQQQTMQSMLGMGAAYAGMMGGMPTGGGGAPASSGGGGLTMPAMGSSWRDR
jgi:hypothetical protein